MTRENMENSLDAYPRLFCAAGVEGAKALLQRGKRAGWTRLLPGIWLTQSPPATFMDWVQAAKLYYGERIGFGGAAGLVLVGVTIDEPYLIDVWIKPGLSTAPMRDSRLHVRRDHLNRLARIHPQTQAIAVGDALADMLNTTENLEMATAAIIHTRKRFPARADAILQTVVQRQRQRHRALAHELLTVQPAFDSVLEYAWVNQVEHPHGILLAQRQWKGPNGYIWDGVWHQHHATLELDGKAFHSGEQAVTRDSAKDRAALAYGYTPIHFGYSDVMRHPCATAFQLLRLIPGLLTTSKPCNPRCPLN